MDTFENEPASRCHRSCVWPYVLDFLRAPIYLQPHGDTELSRWKRTGGWARPKSDLLSSDGCFSAPDTLLVQHVLMSHITKTVCHLTRIAGGFGYVPIWERRNPQRLDVSYRISSGFQTRVAPTEDEPGPAFLRGNKMLYSRDVRGG